VLKTNFDNYEKGPEFFDRFYDVLGHGIFNADGAKWKAQRQTAAPLFTRNTMAGTAPVFRFLLLD
jgi:cytochrome P450